MFGPAKLPAARNEYIQISLRKRTYESIPRSLDELTAPAKLRFIIRRMRYSRAAPSEYFPVMLNEIPAKTQICSLCMQFESPLQILTGSAAFFRDV